MKCIFTVITWGKKAIDITGMFIQHCKEHNRKMQGNSCYLTKIFYRAQTKKKIMVPFYGCSSTVSRLQGYDEETVYFLPFSSHGFCVLS